MDKLDDSHEHNPKAEGMKKGPEARCGQHGRTIKDIDGASRKVHRG